MVLYEDNKAKYDAVSKDLFRLVQRDEKIHDVEFKTKPIDSSWTYGCGL
ncbi:MAG: hypothetical protein ACLU8D_03965 [Enterocloster sp.]